MPQNENELLRSVYLDDTNDINPDDYAYRPPETTLSSVTGSFLGGVFKGFTTFDSKEVGLPVDQPHDNIEAVANSVGHLVGFLGMFIPYTKPASAAMMAWRAEKSIATASKLFKVSELAANFGVRTIPSAPGFIATKVMEGARKGAKSFEALKILGMKQDMALGLLHGFTAGAISGAPLDELDVENRLETGLQMMMFTGGSRVLGNTITEKGIFDASKFWKGATPTQKTYVNSAVRAVASSAIFGGQSTLANQPMEVQVYEYLINGIFGATEKSWVHRAAIEQMAPFLKNEYTHEGLMGKNVETNLKDWNLLDTRVQETIKEEVIRRVGYNNIIIADQRELIVGEGASIIAKARARAEAAGVNIQDYGKETVDEHVDATAPQKGEEIPIISTDPTETLNREPIAEERPSTESAVKDVQTTVAQELPKVEPEKPETFGIGAIKFSIAQLREYAKDPTSLRSREMELDAGIGHFRLGYAAQSRLRMGIRAEELTDMYYKQLEKTEGKLTDEIEAEMLARQEELGIRTPFNELNETRKAGQLKENAERYAEASQLGMIQAIKEKRTQQERLEDITRILSMLDPKVMESTFDKTLLDLSDNLGVPRPALMHYNTMIDTTIKALPEGERAGKRSAMLTDFVTAVGRVMADTAGSPTERLERNFKDLKEKHSAVFADGRAERLLRDLVVQSYDRVDANEVTLTKSQLPVKQADGTEIVDGRWDIISAEGLYPHKNVKERRTQTFWEKTMGQKLFVLKNVMGENGQPVPIHDTNISMGEVIADMHRNGYVFVGGRKDNSQMFFAEQRFRETKLARDENGKVTKLVHVLNDETEITTDIGAFRDAYASRAVEDLKSVLKDNPAMTAGEQEAFLTERSFDSMAEKLESRWNKMATGGKVRYAYLSEEMGTFKNQKGFRVYSDGWRSKDAPYEAEHSFVDNVFYDIASGEVVEQETHKTLEGTTLGDGTNPPEAYKHNPDVPIVLQNRLAVGKESSVRMSRIVDQAVEMGKEVHILDTEMNRPLIDMAMRHGADVVLHSALGPIAGKFKLAKMSERPLRELMSTPQENSWWIQFAHNVQAWEKMNGGKPLAEMVKKGYLNDVFALNQRNQLILGSGEYNVKNDPIFETIGGLLEGQSIQGSIVKLDPRGATAIAQTEFVKGEVVQAAMEAHLDGVMFLRGDVFDALLKYMGKDDVQESAHSGVKGKIGTIKGTILSSDSKNGLLIGKLLWHRADAGVEAHLQESGQHFQMYDTAAKQYGDRPMQYVDFENNKFVYYQKNGEGVRSDHDPKMSVIPLTDFRINPTSKEDIYSTENVMMVKQLLNNLPPHLAKMAYDAYVVPAYEGSLSSEHTADLQKAIKLFATDPNHAEAVELIKNIDVDKMGLKHIMDIMFGNDVASSALYEKVARKLLNMKSSESRDDEGAATDSDGIRSPEHGEDVLELQLFKNNADAILSNVSELTPLIASHDWVKKYVEKLALNYVKKRLETPQVAGSFSAISRGYSQHLIAKHGLKAGQYLLTREMGNKEVELTKAERKILKLKPQEILTLRKLFDQAETKTGNKAIDDLREKLLTHTVIRVPADSVSGVRRLRLRGFADADGFNVVLHPEDMKQLSGMDQDGDKVFVYTKLIPGMEQFFERGEVKDQWYKFHRIENEKIVETLSSKQYYAETRDEQKWTKEFMPVDESGITYKRANDNVNMSLAMFDALSNAETNRASARGNSLLGFGLSRMNAVREYLYQTNASETEIDKAWEMSRNIVNKSADAAKKGNPTLSREELGKVLDDMFIKAGKNKQKKTIARYVKDLPSLLRAKDGEGKTMAMEDVLRNLREATTYTDTKGKETQRYNPQGMRYRVATLIGQLEYTNKAYRGVNDKNVYAVLKAFDGIFRGMDESDKDPVDKELATTIRFALHLFDYSLGGNTGNAQLTSYQDADIKWNVTNAFGKRVHVREAFGESENGELVLKDGYKQTPKQDSESIQVQNRNLHDGTMNMVHAILVGHLANKINQDDIAHWTDFANKNIQTNYDMTEKLKRDIVMGTVGPRENGKGYNIIAGLTTEQSRRNGRAWRIMVDATNFRDADVNELKMLKKQASNYLSYEGRNKKVEEMVEYVNKLDKEERQLFELTFLGSLHQQTKELKDLKAEFAVNAEKIRLEIEKNRDDTVLNIEAIRVKHAMLEKQLLASSQDAATKEFYRAYSSKAAWQHAWVSNESKRIMLNSWNRLVGASRADDAKIFTQELATKILGRELPKIDEAIKTAAEGLDEPTAVSAKELADAEQQIREAKENGETVEEITEIIPQISELDVRAEATAKAKDIVWRVARMRAEQKAAKEMEKTGERLTPEEAASLRNEPKEEMTQEEIDSLLPTPEEQAVYQAEEIRETPTAEKYHVKKYADVITENEWQQLKEKGYQGTAKEIAETQRLEDVLTAAFIAHPELLKNASLIMPGMSMGSYVKIGIDPLFWSKRTTQRMALKFSSLGKDPIELSKWDHVSAPEKINERLALSDMNAMLNKEALVVTREGKFKQPVLEVVSKFGILDRLARANKTMYEGGVAAMKSVLDANFELVSQLDIVDRENKNAGHRLLGLAIHQFISKRKTLTAIESDSFTISPREVAYREEVIAKHKVDREKALVKHSDLFKKTDGIERTYAVNEVINGKKVVTAQEVIDAMETRIFDTVQGVQEKWFFGDRQADGTYLSSKYTHVAFEDQATGYVHLDVKKTMEALMMDLGNGRMPKVGLGLLYRIGRQMSVNAMKGTFQSVEYDAARYKDLGGREQWIEDTKAFAEKKYGIKGDDIIAFNDRGSFETKQTIGEHNIQNQTAAVTYLLKMVNPKTGKNVHQWMIHDDLPLQQAMDDAQGNWPRYDMPVSTVQKHLRERLSKEHGRTLDDQIKVELEATASLTNMMAQKGTRAAQKMIQHLSDVATGKTANDRLNIAKTFSIQEMQQNEVAGRELIGEYNMTAAALEQFQSGMAKTYYNTLYALGAHKTISEFKNEKVMDGEKGENHTEAWSYFMEEWARNVLGYPSTIPDQWLKNKEYAKASTIYRHVYSDQAYLNFWKAKDKVLGKTYMQQSDAIAAIKQSYEVAQNKKKILELRKDVEDMKPTTPEDIRDKKRMLDAYDKDLASQQTHNVSDKDFALAVKSIGRDERILRKIASLSNMEAKWQLITLLANTKTMVNNMLGANINTSVMVGFNTMRKFNNVNYIRAELGGHVNKEWKGTWAQQMGAHETMLKSELAYNPLARGKAVAAAISEAASEMQEKPVWENVKGSWQMTKRAYEIAKKHGVDQMVFEGAGMFMRKSEIWNRNRAWWSGYMKAREIMFADGETWAPDDPWLIDMANRTVEASQFLYHTASRPMFMQTSVGKVLHRFQLYAYRSIEFRNALNQQAKEEGYEVNSDSYKRMARMAVCDMFMLSMAGIYGSSLFSSNLAEPLQTFSNMAQYLFGKKEERENAFYGALPYPMNIVQPLTPSISRYGTNIAGALITGEWDKFANYQVWTMFPFGRQAGMVAKTVKKPSMVLENFVGIPVHKWDQRHTKYQRSYKHAGTTARKLFDDIVSRGQEESAPIDDEQRIENMLNSIE